jgi:hypothetical protein
VQRYPVSENGLALPIQELGYEVMAESDRRSNGHHFYFEREWYLPRHRQLFRNLVGHVVRMRPVDHQDLHERFGPPLMLRDWEMIDYLDDVIATNGLLEVHKERKLRETYQVMPPEWEAIKADSYAENTKMGRARFIQPPQPTFSRVTEALS